MVEIKFSHNYTVALANLFTLYVIRFDGAQASLNKI